MIKAILTDIEGTTSSIDYVKEVMFPYSKEKLETFLQSHWQKEWVRSIIGELEKRLGKPVSLELAIETFKDWIERDLKEPALKELQGHIWEEGFISGELKGHIYEDAYLKLKEWKEKGYRLYVYSSGSVKAQRLFFGHTEYGDLNWLFDGFFDTSVGSKRERSSYEKIANLVGLAPEEFLFLSDREEELRAAELAGMNTALVVREGTPQRGEHRTIRSFYELEP
ncbi:MAG: acireductone synthase [Aquificaceae bacterium]|nr:acireductone synthase [Aquificaceae bacterium]MCS7196781.1 acireductone synthase [Aquificaceae bacterium]MCX7990208.1 acireductone synthase [Aquificaceae bacterium]MDW8032393.1 acireductone synthase [Aquificaceae bacterium]MDW8294303.1 acireductone synthase [Aquificaceae bacterium]